MGVEKQDKPEAQEEELFPAQEDDGDDFDETDLAFLKPKEGEEKEAAGEQEEAPQAEERPAETKPSQPEASPAADVQPQAQPQPEQPAPQQPAQPVQEAPQDQAVVPGLGAEALEEYNREARRQLAQHYQLSDEEKELIQSEPEKVIPEIIGRAVLDSVQFAVQAVMHHLPQVLAAQETQRTQARSVEDKFFEAWPQLKEHAGEVQKYAATYRQMYPQAKLEDAIRDIGAMASVALRVPTEQAQASNQPIGNGAQPERVPPHRPAASAAPRTLAPPTPGNVFSQWADEYAAGDDEY